MIDEDGVRPTQLPVVQPDPWLRENRPGALRVAATVFGGAAIVIMVLYALTRPAEEPQMAANTAETSVTAPALNTRQPNPQPPSTTGQASGDDSQVRAGRPAGPLAAGGAATGTVGRPSGETGP